MQIGTINKTKAATVIAIVLLMASVTPMAMIVQPVQAQDLSGDTYDYTLAHGYKNPQSIYGIPLPAGVTPDFTQATIAHVSFTPDPIGVGQPLLVNVWISPNLQGGRAHKEYDIVFTKPDGTKDTVKIPSFLGDATSFTNYVVDQAGTWQIEFDFPGDYFPAGNYTTPIGTFAGVGVTNNFLLSTYYSPSSDGPYNFTVQSEIVYSWPPAPLPTDYWTRPINLMNREWGEISGWYPATGQYGGSDPYNNWPADTNLYMSNYGYIPYVQGPNSAHILRLRLDSYASGIIGGPLGQYSVSGSGNTPDLIYSGNCYNTLTKYYNGVATSVWVCSDLRTGEVFWEQVLPTGVSAPTWVVYQNPGPASTVAYATQSSSENIFLANIVSGRLIYRNPATGSVSQNVSISPITSGTLYKITDWPYFLSVQNLGTSVPVAERYRLLNWTVFGTVTSSVNYGNPQLQIINNITWPLSSLPSTTDFEAGYAVTTFTAETSNATGIVTNQGITVVSLTTGAVVQNFTTNIGTEHFQSGSSLCVDHGKVAVDFTDGHVYCWDCATGKKLWQSETGEWPWADFYEYGVSSYGGNYIIGTYAGILALDWNTGKVAWLYRSKSPANFESPYQGYNPFFTGVFEADGKVYGYSSEHTPSQPIPRSWGLHCVNATTGEEIWAIMGGGRPGAISDGYLTSSASDGYMYVFGRGQSATTVTASPKTIAVGDTVLIEGTVLDQSPAQPGTPCVSKDSMATHMNYLHMQQPINGIWGNETITGVPVHLLAMASDGTYTDLGTVTSNGYYGTFSKAWTPTKEDTYTIVASFAADDSYGSSSAATAVAVSTAPAVTPTPTPPEAPVDNTPLLTGILAAVVVAIIIGIVAVLLALRKRQ
jgi:outer membrane protein assembly factor BamB